MADAVYSYYMFFQFPIYEEVGILGHQYCPFHLYVQFDIAMVTSNVDLFDDRYVCDDIWMSSISVLASPFGLFHDHRLPAFFWNMVFMILYFVDLDYSNKVSPLSFFNSSPNLPVAISI